MAITWNGIIFPLASCAEPTAFPLRSKEIMFPGVDFADEMDMGRGPRRITLRGRLPNATGGTPSAATLAAIDTSVISTLADTGAGLTFPNTRVESVRIFGWATARAKLAGAAEATTQKTCQYEIVFKQLKGS